MPKRIQMSRQRPWRADNPDAVIVARPTKWGNPYSWQRIPREQMAYSWDDENPPPFSDAQRRGFAVSDFRGELRIGHLSGRYPSVDEIRAELAGRDLACWCPLDQPCHADVLLELANDARALASARASERTS